MCSLRDEHDCAIKWPGIEELPFVGGFWSRGRNNDYFVSSDLTTDSKLFIVIWDCLIVQSSVISRQNMRT